MLDLYWGCLIAGALLAVVTVLFGDSLFDGLLDFLAIGGSSPMSWIGGIAAFGGAGVLLTKYTPMSWGSVLALSVAIAVAFSVLVHFVYVKPMSRAENSTAYSIQDLVGKTGEVIVTIPARGYGEVMMTTGVGTVHHTAESYDRQEIASGSKVLVVDVKDGALSVVPFDEDAL